MVCQCSGDGEWVIMMGMGVIGLEFCHVLEIPYRLDAYYGVSVMGIERML